MPNGAIGTAENSRDRVFANDQMGGGGGDIHLNGPMNFYGNTKAEGRAMADGLKERLDELKRARG